MTTLLFTDITNIIFLSLFIKSVKLMLMSNTDLYHNQSVAKKPDSIFLPNWIFKYICVYFTFLFIDNMTTLLFCEIASVKDSTNCAFRILLLPTHLTTHLFGHYTDLVFSTGCILF
jgi:hypothetical protein